MGRFTNIPAREHEIPKQVWWALALALLFVAFLVTNVAAHNRVGSLEEVIEANEKVGGLSEEVLSLRVEVLEASLATCESELASVTASVDDLRATIEELQKAVKELKKPAVSPPVPVAAADTSKASTGWNSAVVSWYGPGFYGNTTASGAVFVEGMMNFAHKTMKFGTMVEFGYNGKTVTAVCNDRGPYVAGRTFDLGPGTAAALGFSGVNTVKWRYV